MATTVAPSVPPTGPTGQVTLDAIIAFIESAVAQLSGPAAQAVRDGMALLHAFQAVVDPAAGKEIEREADLAAMFTAHDVNGLKNYYNDKPAHPNKSLGICAGYLKALGATTAPVPAPVAAAPVAST